MQSRLEDPRGGSCHQLYCSVGKSLFHCLLDVVVGRGVVRRRSGNQQAVVLAVVVVVTSFNEVVLRLACGNANAIAVEDGIGHGEAGINTRSVVVLIDENLGAGHVFRLQNFLHHLSGVAIHPSQVPLGRFCSVMIYDLFRKVIGVVGNRTPNRRVALVNGEVFH